MWTYLRSSSCPPLSPPPPPPPPPPCCWSSCRRAWRMASRSASAMAVWDWLFVSEVQRQRARSRGVHICEGRRACPASQFVLSSPQAPNDDCRDHRGRPPMTASALRPAAPVCPACPPSTRYSTGLPITADQRQSLQSIYEAILLLRADGVRCCDSHDIRHLPADRQWKVTTRRMTSDEQR